MKIADVGNPGSTTIGLPSATPRHSGLPGLSATPCTITPGAPRVLEPDAPLSQEFLAAQTHLHEKKLLRLFYSRERFMSPEAKYSFVPPDLAPFPTFARIAANCAKIDAFARAHPLKQPGAPAAA